MPQSIQPRFALWSSFEGELIRRHATETEVRAVMHSTLELLPDTKFEIFEEDMDVPPKPDAIDPAWLKPLGAIDLRAAVLRTAVAAEAA